MKRNGRRHNPASQKGLHANCSLHRAEVRSLRMGSGAQGLPQKSAVSPLLATRLRVIASPGALPAYASAESGRADGRVGFDVSG